MNFSQTIPNAGGPAAAVLGALRGQGPAVASALAPVATSMIVDLARRYADRKGLKLPEGKLTDFAELAKQLDICRIVSAFTSDAADIRGDTRRPIPRWLRLEIVKSQDWKCHYGFGKLKKSRFSPGNYWEIDHKVPVSKGGSDDRSNLVATCRKHNRAKGTDDYLRFWIRRITDLSLWQCGNWPDNPPRSR